MALEKVKGHCPTCGGERYADVVAQHEEKWSDDYASGSVRHSILRCRGCETVYVQRAESHSEDDDHFQDADGNWYTVYPERMTYWPAPTKRSMPGWHFALYIDPDLRNLFDELYTALNTDLRVLAAIGVRTIFDRTSELLGVDASLTFERKLEALEVSGRIGKEERDQLAVLADAGGAAAHRSWRPTPEQLDTLVSTLEAFLNRTLVLGDALKKLRAEVPQKPARVSSKSRAVSSE